MLQNMCVLVTLHRHMWTARKLDRQVTKDTTERMNADDDAATVTKKIIPQEALDGIKKIYDDVYSYHKNNTSCWDDNGYRLLTNLHYHEYYAKMMEFADAYADEVDKFINDIYQDYRLDAMRRMGDMFKETDYPTPDALYRRFGIKMEFTQLPEKGGIKLQGINQDLLDEMNKNQNANIDRRYKESAADIWNRIRTGVKTIAKADNKGGRIYTATIDNLKEACKLAPKYNLMDDPELLEVAKEAKKLTIYSMDEIAVKKGGNPIRSSIVFQAKDLLERINYHMVDNGYEFTK